MERTIGILTLALALSLATAAEAQHPQTREGFGISLGLGAGSASLTCDGCPQYGGTEPSGYLRLGGYVSPALYVAVESDGWAVINIVENNALIGAFMGVALWYPIVSQGWYVKGGLGYAYADALGDIFDAADLHTSGFAVSLGAGYDWRVARGFALTPYINYLAQLGGTYSDSDGSDTGLDASVHVFQFGLGFTWF